MPREHAYPYTARRMVARVNCYEPMVEDMDAMEMSGHITAAYCIDAPDLIPAGAMKPIAYFQRPEQVFVRRWDDKN